MNTEQDEIPLSTLGNLMHQGRQHWKEFQPTKYAELKKSGKLEEALKAAANLTYQAMNTLIDSGIPQHEAWMQTREQYLLLPDENKDKDEKEIENPVYDAIMQSKEDRPRILNEADEATQP